MLRLLRWLGGPAGGLNLWLLAGLLLLRAVPPSRAGLVALGRAISSAVHLRFIYAP